MLVSNWAPRPRLLYPFSGSLVVCTSLMSRHNFLHSSDFQVTQVCPENEQLKSVFTLFLFFLSSYAFVLSLTPFTILNLIISALFSSLFLYSFLFASHLHHHRRLLYVIIVDSPVNLINCCWSITLGLFKWHRNRHRDKQRHKSMQQQPAHAVSESDFFICHFFPPFLCYCFLSLNHHLWLSCEQPACLSFFYDNIHITIDARISSVFALLLIPTLISWLDFLCFLSCVTLLLSLGFLCILIWPLHEHLNFFLHNNLLIWSTATNPTSSGKLLVSFESWQLQKTLLTDPSNGSWKCRPQIHQLHSSRTEQLQRTSGNHSLC